MTWAFVNGAGQSSEYDRCKSCWRPYKADQLEEGFCNSCFGRHELSRRLKDYWANPRPLTPMFEQLEREYREGA